MLRTVPDADRSRLKDMLFCVPFRLLSTVPENTVKPKRNPTLALSRTKTERTGKIKNLAFVDEQAKHGSASPKIQAGLITQLTNVNLSTGVEYQAHRPEFPLAAVEHLYEWLLSAKNCKSPFIDEKCLCANIPHRAIFNAMIFRDGDNLLITIFHEKPGTCLAFGVAPTVDDGASLWVALEGKGLLPEAPWCAVRQEIGLTLVQTLFTPDVAWMSSFASCITWTWLSMLKKELLKGANHA